VVAGPGPSVATAMSTSARGVGFDLSGTTMGRTGRPHHSPCHRLHIMSGLWSVRNACRRRSRDPTGFYGPPAGRGSYATLFRTLRVPPPAAGLNRVLRAVSRPRELRDNAPRHGRPRDHTGTAGCGLADYAADGATRRCSTSRAHLAVLTQRGLRAGSTLEPRGASGRVDQTGGAGKFFPSFPAFFFHLF
jgi:hypothetical protein